MEDDTPDRNNGTRYRYPGEDCFGTVIDARRWTVVDHSPVDETDGIQRGMNWAEEVIEANEWDWFRLQWEATLPFSPFSWYVLSSNRSLARNRVAYHPFASFPSIAKGRRWHYSCGEEDRALFQNGMCQTEPTSWISVLARYLCSQEDPRKG